MYKITTAFLTAMTLLTAVAYSESEVRTISHAERTREKEMRAKEQAEHGKSNKAVKALYSAFTYDTSYPGCWHFPTDVTPAGDALALEDGSGWYVADSDCIHTRNWLVTDQIFITQNTSFFSSYDYLLINQSSGASVRANLARQPSITSSYTRYITGFHDSLKYIYLNDNTVWAVYFYDHVYFSRWCLSDTVIVGVNSGWDNYSRPNILINATLNQYLRAHRVQ